VLARELAGEAGDSEEDDVVLAVGHGRYGSPRAVRRALCRAINTSGYFYRVVSGGSKNERNHRHETRSNGFADRWDGDTHRIRAVQAAGGIETPSDVHSRRVGFIGAIDVSIDGGADRV
jgi:hypothetical protein